MAKAIRQNEETAGQFGLEKEDSGSRRVGPSNS